MRSVSLLRRWVWTCCCFLLCLTASAQTRRLEETPNLEQARINLETALKDKTNPLSNELTSAAHKFVEAAKKPEDVQRLKRATDDLEQALAAEQSRSLENGKTFREGDKVAAIRDAVEAANKVSVGDGKGAKASPSPSATASVTNNRGNTDNESVLMSLVWPIAGGVAGVGLIVLAVFGILRWRSGFWMKLDGHVSDIVAAHVGGVKKRHDEMAKHLTTVGEEQRKTASRLESIEGEIQALGRRLRQGALDGGGFQGSSVRQAFDEYARQPVQPVEPEFPASADEYLNKMKRNSIVVKPDFQNGILVNDIDGKGELVLIRNSSIPDDAQPLFVVPRVTQFQTKQEFHSYYERYYDCQRPSAGDVWIIDPAIVSTVPGGWELREKGVLEVR